MNKEWLLIRDNKKSGYWNMAADEELLSFEKPVLRIYGFSPPCLTLGYGMNGVKDIDYDFCKKNNIDVTRRITGGKAVLHDNEITYSLSAPISFFNNSLINAYKKSAEVLEYAFKHFGVKIQSQSNITKSDTPICFLEKSYYEISYNLKKLAGFAQKKSGKKILQHCSIPLKFDFNILAGCFGLNNSNQIKLMNEKISCLSDIIGKDIFYDEFSDILILAFKKVFNINFLETIFSFDQENRIIERINSKYILPCWIEKKIT